MAAYDVFADAASSHALKVVLTAEPTQRSLVRREEALAGAGR
jgi:hypothetical protein